MRLALVYLPELFLIVNLNPDSILEHILNMLLAQDRLPVFIRSLNYLLKVRRMAPSDLNCGGRLSYMGKNSRQ